MREKKPLNQPGLFPKGYGFSKIDKDELLRIERWMNSYPRRVSWRKSSP